MFSALTDHLIAFSRDVPLELFTFVGSFIEELIAPIPSPVVMMASGSIADAQMKPMIYLLVLSLIGATGKTIGALLVYWIAMAAEGVIFRRFGWLFGVTHEEVVALGKRFDGTWKDMFLMTFLRALPIMSSSVVSVCSGFVRIHFGVYVVSTFIGTIVRDFFYLYVGYTGIAALRNLVDGFDSAESVIQAVIALLIVGGFIWIVWRRKRRSASAQSGAPMDQD